MATPGASATPPFVRLTPTAAREQGPLHRWQNRGPGKWGCIHLGHSAQRGCLSPSPSTVVPALRSHRLLLSTLMCRVFLLQCSIHLVRAPERIRHCPLPPGAHDTVRELQPALHKYLWQRDHGLEPQAAASAMRAQPVTQHDHHELASKLQYTGV